MVIIGKILMTLGTLVIVKNISRIARNNCVIDCVIKLMFLSTFPHIL